MANAAQWPIVTQVKKLCHHHGARERWRVIIRREGVIVVPVVALLAESLLVFRVISAVVANLNSEASSPRVVDVRLFWPGGPSLTRMLQINGGDIAWSVTFDES
ncbi:unnamed protein product [Discosporangium mesarthrocarpum]